MLALGLTYAISCIMETLRLHFPENYGEVDPLLCITTKACGEKIASRFYQRNEYFSSMKKFFACLILMFCATRSQGDCDAVLVAVLNTTEWKTEEAFDAHLRSYFFSEEFEQDMREKRFKGKYIDFPKEYSGEYDDQKFHEFREKLVSDTNFQVSREFKVAYLEKRANKDVLDKWIRCYELNRHEPTLSLKVQSESGKECVVTLSHAAAGAPAKVTGVTTLGCSQQGFWFKPIRKGVSFDATKPLQATLIKAPGAEPSIVVSTTIGVETLTLKPFPTPPSRSAAPDDRLIQPKTLGGDAIVIDQPGPPSFHLSNQDFSTGEDQCSSSLRWKVMGTSKNGVFSRFQG